MAETDSLLLPNVRFELGQGCAKGFKWASYIVPIVSFILSIPIIIFPPGLIPGLLTLLGSTFQITIQCTTQHPIFKTIFYIQTFLMFAVASGFLIAFSTILNANLQSLLFQNPQSTASIAFTQSILALYIFNVIFVLSNCAIVCYHIRTSVLKHRQLRQEQKLSKQQNPIPLYTLNQNHQPPPIIPPHHPTTV